MYSHVLTVIVPTCLPFICNVFAYDFFDTIYHKLKKYIYLTLFIQNALISPHTSHLNICLSLKIINFNFVDFSHFNKVL